jgi:hypothetical protein
MLSLSEVDRGSTPVKTKDYRIGICCFSAKHTALRSKSKDWLTQIQDNVSKWSKMSIHGMLFKWANTIKIQLSMLIYYKADIIIISLKVNCYHYDIAEILLTWL